MRFSSDHKMQLIHIFGGGTYSDVRSHLSLAARARGTTARDLARQLRDQVRGNTFVKLELTEMAAPDTSRMATNEDVAKRVDELVADPQTKVIIFNVALCDVHGQIGDIESGKYAERLKSREGPFTMNLTMADKIIGRIRKERKDIFLVAFKTTTHATSDEQYKAGLNLLKANSCNIVFANDTGTRNNMIIVPEEARYCETTDREKALRELGNMIVQRSNLTFTRSTVIEGESIAWKGDQVPDSLRKVVDHCIAKGAYKPFRGSTAGHFAYRVNDTTFITSKRKVDYNNLEAVGMVKIESTGPDSIVAHGARPSVGGMSQRIVFKEHPGYDNIVHFHCPPKFAVPTASQFPYECGSHECGQNTSSNLKEVEDGIKVVYLDNHGPNIVFRNDVPPERVISYIDRNFDLGAKTGGLLV